MSSGNSAFVDLTSSPRTAVHDGPATMSTVDLADPSLDFTDVRASLNALQQAIDQTEALRELRQDHDVLRRKFLATRRRREDLDRQLAGAANAASPYVLFCQRKYEVVHHQLESTQKELAECLDAQQERLDNSHELEACRLRYRDLLLDYNEAVYEFQDRVFILEVQLAAASSFEVARDRQASLDSELRESATQAEVDRLEAAVERKTRRFRALREG
ncbi:hypothetical protein F442_21792 [Phytophthora nicotianae P10297]|uniref:Uncharacterized protein n=1 Tax=Phytophthora nicotianae P10297 TaxID=1317064 RepID=W2Y1Y8_PHYNI|nr:hypothetical protein F442_21792 [Phytophthora nicotianae P10297]